MNRLSFALLFFCALIIVSYPVDIRAQLYTPVVKKLTNFAYDSREASFFQYEGNYASDCSEILYTAVHNSSSDICILKYNAQQDTFFSSIPLVSDGYRNSNPIGKQIINNSSARIIFWVTDRRGNKDIACALFSNGTLGPVKYLTSTPGDETNPKLFLDYQLHSNYNIDLHYTRNGSVYHLYATATDTVEKQVFMSSYPNDSVSYSEAAGMLENPSARLYVYAAIKKVKNEEPKLVYKYWRPDSALSSEYPVYAGTGLGAPRFIHGINMASGSLVFNANITGRKSLLMLAGRTKFGNNAAATEFSEEPTGDILSFSHTAVYVVGEKNTQTFRLSGPQAYLSKRQDSLSVVIVPQYYNPKRYVPLKVKSSFTETGVPKRYVNQFGILSYIIWEDSSDGHINLFGYARYDAFGDVNETGAAESSQILSSYPNPYNANTVVRYEVKRQGRVKVGAFDVTGQERAVLFDGDKPAGVYRENFNAVGFPSGIYFIRLAGEGYSKTIKTVLLR